MESCERVAAAVRAVLPDMADVHFQEAPTGLVLEVGGQLVSLAWIGEGRLADARRFLADRSDVVDVVVGRCLSPGAREALSQAGIGFVDETGAAEIAVGPVLVSRTGSRPSAAPRAPRWTSSVIAVAEALLCGVSPTVSATAHAAGLSTGSATNALRALTEFGLLIAEESRGPRSGRAVADPARLLSAYADAVEQARPKPSIAVGVTWRDPVSELVRIGEMWDQEGIAWAATGAAAATVMAPLLTSVTTTEVYLGADTVLVLEAAAAKVGLRPIQGGRLTLTSFPTTAARHMAEASGGLRVAPWPRVYVDLARMGVRGEEAAEHLREVLE